MEKEIFAKNKMCKMHFIGVLGVSMSGLAKLFAEKGYIVTGSDKAKGSLEKWGIKVYEGHKIENVMGADIVVYSSAIKKDNVEYRYAVENGILCMSRAELLRSVMKTYRKTISIAGCHGKTTATSMLISIFKEAEFAFTSNVGGDMVGLGNYYSSGKDYFILEACEYKKNLNKLSGDINAVLNVDNDHLDCYKNFGELKETFIKFLNSSKSKSFVNIDDDFLKNYSKNCITFGIKNKSANVRGIRVKEKNGKSSFCVSLQGKKPFKVNLNVVGKCHVINALCAISIAKYLGIENEIIVRGLENFQGVERRFEKLKSIGACQIYSDYAHHPKEIESSLKTFKNICKNRGFVVFQPHTYSRTKLLLQDFYNALMKIDKAVPLVIFKEFPAREKYDYLGSAKRLYEVLEKRKNTYYIEDENLLKEFVLEKIDKSKMGLFLGAGALHDFAKNLNK